MKRRIIIATTFVVLLVITGLQTACNYTEEAGTTGDQISNESVENENGFVPMFDGETLAGWQTTGNWVVEEDGVVTLIPRPGEEGWQRYDAYLSTTRKYKDFILNLEFKIEETGNSGVFLRIGRSPEPCRFRLRGSDSGYPRQTRSGAP